MVQGLRGAPARQATGAAARPFAEKAYDMYMNPRDAESFSINPISNFSGALDAGGPMYAMKPKGGNYPTTMGSTLPLSEQGNVGKHLSKTQITDPLDTWYESLPTSKKIEWDTYLNEYAIYRTKLRTHLFNLKIYYDY